MISGVMAKVIRVTEVPDDVHAELRARAEADGQSLTAYLREQLTRIAREPAPAPPRGLASEDAESVIERMRAAGVTKKREAPRY